MRSPDYGLGVRESFAATKVEETTKGIFSDLLDLRIWGGVIGFMAPGRARFLPRILAAIGGYKVGAWANKRLNRGG